MTLAKFSLQECVIIEEGKIPFFNIQQGGDFLFIVIITVIWFYIFSLTIFYFRTLKSEISYLPSVEKLDFNNYHPLVLTNLKEELVLPENLIGKSAIVLIMSPICPPCHKALAQLIKDIKSQKIRYTVYADSVIKEDYNSLVQQYNNQIPIYPLSENELHSLNVDFFPMFLVINSKGFVKKITPSFNEAKSKLKSVS